MIRRTRAVSGALVGLLMIGGAHAADENQQYKNAPTKKTAPQQQPAARSSGTPARIGMPSPKNLFIMIRTTLIALHQANVTGNYSVLRDLSAPSFRQANSVERLSTIFTDLRTRGDDMAPVVLAMPTLSQPPAIDENGMLRLAGHFDTRPNELYFDLVFQAVGGFWRLDAIGAQFRPPVRRDDTARKAGSTDKPSANPKARADTARRNQKIKQ